MNRRPDGVEMHPEEIADRARRIRLEELQPRGRLRKEVQRHRKEEERDGKQQYPRDMSAPDVEDDAVEQKRNRRECDTRLQGARRRNEEEQTTPDEEPTPARGADRRGLQLIARMPDQKGDDQR